CVDARPGDRDGAGGVPGLGQVSATASSPLTEVAEHTTHAPPGPPRTGWRLLLAPGWLRVPWMTALFFGIGFGIVVGLRALARWEPVLDWIVIVTVAALITAPIGFLAGIGAFDYWVHYVL